MTFTTLTTFKRPAVRRTVSAAETSRHKDIDQEIRKYEDAVRQLKSKRNGLAVVARVPPEIISKIFMFCAASCASELNTLAWIKVAHVSRHWRAVALGCPALWSTPVFSSSKWAHEMIKRSKMAPLTIKADLTLMTPKMIEAVQNALKHISRTTHLQFTASNGTIDKLLGHLEQPAPFLESLSISNSYPNYHHLVERYAFPDSFLQGDAPRLRDLELIRCSIPWDSALFHNLSHLKICDTGLQCLPTIEEMVTLLQKMPSLESLDLSDCLPTLAVDAVAAPAPVAVVSLPLLSRLQLCGQTLECANLLNHISFPATATVHLICKGNDATEGDFSTLLPSLSTWLKRSSPIRRVLVDHFTTSTVKFQFWNSCGIDATIPTVVPALHMELSWQRFQASIFQGVVASVAKAFPLNHLRALHFKQPIDSLAADAWVSTFGILPKLRVVDFHGRALTQLVKALKTVTEQKQMIFPALRSVLLSDVAFEVDEKLRSMVDELQETLLFRADHNAELHQLSLTGCYNIYDEPVEKLGEAVKEVNWDGCVADSDDGMESDDSDHGLLSLDPGFGSYMDSEDEAF
ncbi:hypothetical protein C8J56DRAFT_379638 [Mycena floridula]|nr:hypothetical protein C8J56DRAFT_379638 [Mycena floridula]